MVLSDLTPTSQPPATKNPVSQMTHRLLLLLFPLVLYGCADSPYTSRTPAKAHSAGGYTFNPYTGQYVGAEPPGSSEQRAAILQYMHDRTSGFIRRHWVPGHTILSDRGDLIITENGVQRVILNPWRSTTHVESDTVAGKGHEDDDNPDGDSNDDQNE